jgi:tetratricopeptide (TPR) repeat protein
VYMLENVEIERTNVPSVVPTDVAKRLASLRASNAAAPSSFIDCGNAFLSFGMLEDAIDAFTEAVNRDGACLAALLGRGQAAFGLALLLEEETERGSLVSQSIADFQRALELDEQSREAILGIGSGLLVTNRFAECASWIQDEIASTTGKSHEGDLLYLLALCRLFSGDLEQAGKFADRMERVAGFDTERFFIRGLISLQANEREKFLEYRTLVDRRDRKLGSVLGSAEEQHCGTFLDLMRRLVA